MGYLSGLPDQADLWDVIRAREGTWAFLLNASETIMRGPSPLSVAERELIATYVSGLNACDYCFDAHGIKATALGYSEAVTAALLEDPATAPVDQKLRPLFAFAKKLTAEPEKVIEADVQAIREVGWDDDAVSSVIAVVSWFNFINRVVLGHGCRLRDDVLATFTAPSNLSRRESYDAYVRSQAEGD